MSRQPQPKQPHSHAAPREFLHLRAETLYALPTLAQGQSDNLKIETPDVRVWLSRCTRADGARYNHAVTVETYCARCGKWLSASEYDGGTITDLDAVDDESARGHYRDDVQALDTQRARTPGRSARSRSRRSA